MRKLYHNDFDVSSALKQSGSFVYVPYPAPFEAEVLVVAGGGGGGHATGGEAGGGGGGGLFLGTLTIGVGETNITIGEGGDGGDNSVGLIGSGSIVSGSGLNIVTIGGGGGGSSINAPAVDGVDGGSGGGAAANGTTFGTGGTGLQPLSGSDNFGTNGGDVLSTGGAAGGGGSYLAGGDYDGVQLGSGGPGKTIDISGTSIEYARGGDSTSAGGGASLLPGAGGFGSDRNPANNNNKGRNGIVIIRYEGPTIKARGGTLTKVGDDFVHTFTSDGVLYN